MATVAGPSSQHAKYDDFVEAQLEKARKRIRSLDVMTALLGFAAGTLVYAVVMALLDNWLTLPPAALYSAFFVYLGAALVYLGVTVVRPLTARINPYFAARQVEQTLPGAKNSVVNWLDLHADEKLPSAIHGAVSQKAARDLAKADLEKAVSGRRAGWMGAVVAGLCGVLLILLFSLGARKLFSHLGRAFLPFGGQGVAKRTEIIVLEPEGGNASIAADQRFTVRVRVNGRVPETVRLIVQRTRTDPEQEFFLDQDKGAPGEWAVTVPASEVKNGFFYRVVGGDASTEEYRLDVRSTPAILADRFTATYRYRPYFGPQAERVVRKDRTLRDFRGTSVTLDVPTNRKLRSGEVVLLSTDQKLSRTIPAQIVAGNETALKAQFVLEWSGSYFIRFTSAEGESYVDAPPFPMEVRPDTPPTVELTEPGKDETLAADALLKLKGTATDDVGVKELTLRLKTADGVTLKAKPYRSPEALKLTDGGYPNHVEYQDFLDLAQVKDAAGKPFALKPGMVLEYWLEARDACDYPEPKAGNVAESKHYKVTIAEPRRDEKKKEQERQQAQKEQQQHEKKQDQEQKQENDKRRQQNEQQKQANQEARDQAAQNQQGGKGKKEGQPKDNKGGEGSRDQRSPKQKQKDDENRQKRDQLNEAARKAEEEQRKEKEKAEQERRDREKGNAKGDGEPGKRGEAKGNPDKGTGGNDNQPDKSEKKQDHGKGKGAGPDDKKGEKENKAKPQPEKDGRRDQSGGKGKGKPEQGNREQGSTKDNAGMKDGEQPAQGKNDPGKKPEKRDGRAQAKGGEQQPGTKQENKAKPEGSRGSEARGKDGGKPEKGGQPRADKKDAGGKEGDRQATAKDGKEQGKGQKQQAKSDGHGAAKGNEGRQQEKNGQDTAKDGGKAKPDQAKGAGKDGGKQGREEKAAAKDGQGQQGEKRADAKDGTRQGDRKETEHGSAKGGKGQDGEKKAGEEKVAQGQGEKSKGKESGKEQTADNKRSTAKGQPQQTAKGQCKECKDGQSAGGAKPSASGKSKAKPETKPTGGDGGSNTATAKDDRVKGDSPGKAAMKKPAEEVTREEIEELAKALQSDDPKVRREAAKKLDEVRREGKEDVRQAAEEKLGEARGGKPAASVKRSPKGDQQPGQPKEGDKGQKAAQAKGSGEVKQQQSTGKPSEQTVKTGRGKDTGGRGRQLDAPPEDLKTEAADGRFRDRAGQLQLDKFNEKVRKKILKDAKMTEAEYKQLKADLARRPLPPPDPEPVKKPVAGSSGEALKTTGAVRVRAGNDKGVGRSDEGQPPREYRDAYQRLTRELGK